MFKRLTKFKILFIVSGVIILLILPIYFILQDSIFLTGEQKINNLIPIIASTTISYQQEDEDFGLPIQIRIPKIGVDAAIEQVGITSQGEIGVPKGPTGVAWFELGTLPGKRGSAVITGHYGWKDGIAAVFDNLYKLQNEDKVYVHDDKGNVITFVVRESRRYDPKEDASAVFASNDDKAHLNLITCEGVWNKDQQSYSKRLVVFADREYNN
jgi:LPXTG-site transpeptidase (sortase) family protein